MSVATGNIAPACGLAPAPLTVNLPAEYVPPVDPPPAWDGTADLWRTTRQNLLTHHPVITRGGEVHCAVPTCAYFPCVLTVAAAILLDTPERSALYAIASRLRQSAATAVIARQRLSGWWPPV
jgi:hypothetical protein